MGTLVALLGAELHVTQSASLFGCAAASPRPEGLPGLPSLPFPTRRCALRSRRSRKAAAATAPQPLFSGGDAVGGNYVRAGGGGEKTWRTARLGGLSGCWRCSSSGRRGRRAPAKNFATGAARSPSTFAASSAGESLLWEFGLFSSPLTYILWRGKPGVGWEEEKGVCLALQHMLVLFIHVPPPEQQRCGAVGEKKLQSLCGTARCGGN